MIALREFAGDGHRRNAELVEYTPDGEAVLAGGTVLLGARVEATAAGFVMGLRLVRAALGFFGGQELQLDLAEFGFNLTVPLRPGPSGCPTGPKGAGERRHPPGVGTGPGPGAPGAGVCSPAGRRQGGFTPGSSGCPMSCS